MPAKTTWRTIELPDKLLAMADAKFAERGSDFTTFVRMALRQFVKMPDVFELGTVMTFGKYAEETIEDIIRLDPSYVVWIENNVAGFLLSPEADELLEAMLPSGGVRVTKLMEETKEYVTRMPKNRMIDSTSAE